MNSHAHAERAPAEGRGPTTSRRCFGAPRLVVTAILCTSLVAACGDDRLAVDRSASAPSTTTTAPASAATTGRDATPGTTRAGGGPCLNSSPSSSPNGTNPYSYAVVGDGQLWVERPGWPACAHAGDRVTGVTVARLDPNTGEAVQSFTVDPSAFGADVGTIQTSIAGPGVVGMPLPFRVEGSTAWFAVNEPGRTSVARLVGVDATDGTVVRTVDLPAGIVWVEKGGDKAFGARTSPLSPGAPDTPDGRQLTRVDLATGMVDEVVLRATPRQITAGDGVLYLLLPSPNGTGLDTVARLDPTTGALTELRDLNLPLTTVGTGPSGVWVAAATSPITVVRIDPFTGEALATATLPGSEPSPGRPTLLVGSRGLLVDNPQTVNGFAGARRWWVDDTAKVTEVPWDPRLNPIVGIIDDHFIGLTADGVVSSPAPS